jgi:hypothetical protein
MTEPEKVIKGLMRLHGSKETMDIIFDAINLLKGQEPRVMTLEEVKQHNNQDGCVWFEQPTYNANASFAIQDDECDECTEIISPYILGEHINHGYWSNSNYNRTWRCWTSRPTDEQRKAVKWNE